MLRLHFAIEAFTQIDESPNSTNTMTRSNISSKVVESALSLSLSLYVSLSLSLSR